VCALKPGIPGLSENIKVRSIVGRFLEHHRVFYFRADGEEQVYLSSADWMDRNFFRRIELCFPVLDKKHKARVIKEGLNAYLGDNVQAWEMTPDGSYARKTPGKARRSVQEDLLEWLAPPREA
jgi:polyphosphate kinase